MKKFLSILLLLCLCMSISGCNKNTAQESTDNDAANEIPPIAETVSYPRGTSETAITLYNEYKLFAAEEDFELTDLSFEDDYTQFYVNYKNKSNCVLFHLNEKSFIAYIDAEKGSETEKEIIARLLMGLDNISESNALNFAAQLVSSEITKNLSEPVSIGDYIVTLEYWVSDSYINSWLNFHHIDEIQKNVDVTEYSEIEKNALDNSLNYKKKVKLEGSVSGISSFKNAEKYYINIIVTDDHSNKYVCEYCYNDMPIIFTERDRCTVYGEINYTYDTSKSLEMCVNIEKILKN